MTEPAHADHLRRLRAARATGRIPIDLLPWLLEAVIDPAADYDAVGMSPSERLALQVSELIDRWMRNRSVTHRTISCNRRTLARALKGGNVTLASLSDIADSLGCDVVVTFRPRGRDGTVSAISGATR